MFTGQRILTNHLLGLWGLQNTQTSFQSNHCAGEMHSHPLDPGNSSSRGAANPNQESSLNSPWNSFPPCISTLLRGNQTGASVSPYQAGVAGGRQSCQGHPNVQTQHRAWVAQCRHPVRVRWTAVRASQGGTQQMTREWQKCPHPSLSEILTASLTLTLQHWLFVSWPTKLVNNESSLQLQAWQPASSSLKTATKPITKQITLHTEAWRLQAPFSSWSPQ